MSITVENDVLVEDSPQWSYLTKDLKLVVKRNPEDINIQGTRWQVLAAENYLDSLAFPTEEKPNTEDESTTENKISKKGISIITPLDSPKLEHDGNTVSFDAEGQEKGRDSLQEKQVNQKDGESDRHGHRAPLKSPGSGAEPGRNDLGEQPDGSYREKNKATEGTACFDSSSSLHKFGVSSGLSVTADSKARGAAEGAIGGRDLEDEVMQAKPPDDGWIDVPPAFSANSGRGPEFDFIDSKKADSKTVSVTLVSGIRVYVYEADITKLTADAIACASNAQMKNTVGVAKFLSKAAGPAIVDGCKASIKTHGNLRQEEVRMTEGGNLHCKYVFHAFGPHKGIGKPEDQPQWLYNTVRNILEKAEECKVTTLAVPTIGAGKTAMALATATHNILQPINDHALRFGASSSLTEVHLVDVVPEVVKALGSELLRMESLTAGKNGHAGGPDSPVPPTRSKKKGKNSCINCNTGNGTPVSNCQHVVCGTCRTKAAGQCPVCAPKSYPSPSKNLQPGGAVTVKFKDKSLSGYPKVGTIVLLVDIPEGIQKEGHSKPGRKYVAKVFKNHLPNNDQGKKIAQMFQLAFDMGLLIAINKNGSPKSNTLLKESMKEGEGHEYYPDPDYLNAAEDALVTLGVPRDQETTV